MQHTDLSPEESNQKTIEAVSAARPKLFGKFNVDGDKSWSSPYISVRQLIFRPGSRLIFDEAVTRANRNIFIFAEEIISEDQENPGTITWVDVAPSIPPAAGSGVAGANQGGAENVGGGMGGTGPEGLRGELGATAPSLTIVVKNIVGGLKLGLRGEDGGSGGVGGPGGPGGADARPYCQGAGNDGPAGPAGGQGGAGASGQSGVPGQYYVGGLSVADIEGALK
ncbi:hypothetical protein JAB5_00270 [Janthinobacterium sp. HH103]|uniref:hypothetical protein n=1 Tax=Janthinobacterium sp. HH103 TaxID=1537275 RepID=UPI0008931AF5|nr:hypothetical protein [Janthinobacterium sp. HH103]OEZ89651.1 hypothetical protein JAB5_00270 [Janthinobacterium sp. HH103]